MPKSRANTPDPTNPEADASQTGVGETTESGETAEQDFQSDTEGTEAQTESTEVKPTESAESREAREAATQSPVIASHNERMADRMAAKEEFGSINTMEEIDREGHAPGEQTLDNVP